MRLLILGAGATGGYFGGLLANAGADVTFLVRPKRRDQLVRDGLTIESRDLSIATPVKAITREEIANPYDAVILSSKAYDLADAIDTIRPAVGEKTLILPLLNGMRHLDNLDDAFGKQRVLGGTCHISVVLEPDGKIRHLSPFASLTAGPRFAPQEKDAKRLHGELARGGFDARYSENIIGAMWEKWVLLATLAGSTCLMRASIGEIVRAGGAQLISDMLDECCAIAKASGYPPTSAADSGARTTLTDPNSNISASMRRDIERGNRIEADHIVGDLISRGRELGVPSPMLDVAYLHLQAYQNRSL
ncbi:2-dehydropantoate 2-reductase [Hyphomicrobium sp.]|jgi:2-dehydropantoate 2-reductase|uniref:2-dehydropantoate 2-reductase n=1 Tax=Hyphomicrobium sp. TaxID=82 RepID=UPI002CF0D1BC|nr:2-dehydropantoate 2-reductase [Hyphomicrobium sp.]HVZ06114.1 2-dehydropantoate 2-reductase [Hyphomicrobium sp.]